jgi:hypothetical protein
MAMSSFGQTYFISLYGQEFRQTFDSAMADWAGCTPSAVMSAVTLTWQAG